MLLEICVDSLDSVIACAEAGADRIELCASLTEGGLTPSAGILSQARALFPGEIAFMIRPRGGDFAYRPEEIFSMAADIELARDLGADAVVFGCLEPDGALDLSAIETLLDACDGFPAVFHRAFDVCRDLPGALEILAELGFERILTSGGAPSVIEALDPIAALGEIANAKDVWLHVDACVGGYFAPFARMNGVPVPAFDFEVPGVRSMSADLHKYGYCAKGASTVLFRSEELYRHMPFSMRDWSGAPMKTPTLAGTRPGGAISAAWAVMNVLGVSGYREKQGIVCATREKIEAGVRALGFEILGKPQLGLVAFRHPEAETLALYSAIRARGWFTSFTAEPASLHLMLSPKHAEVADAYLADLAASLDAVRNGVSAPKVEARYS